MKATCALVLVVSLGIVDAAAQEGPAAVRAMDAGAVEACAHGRAASASFRALVESFDPEHVVVHVETGVVRVFGTAGATRLPPPLEQSSAIVIPASESPAPALSTR